jgi:hypothetical protein
MPQDGVPVMVVNPLLQWICSFWCSWLLQISIEIVDHAFIICQDIEDLEVMCIWVFMPQPWYLSKLILENLS